MIGQIFCSYRNLASVLESILLVEEFGICPFLERVISSDGQAVIVYIGGTDTECVRKGKCILYGINALCSYRTALVFFYVFIACTVQIMSV